ncbi:MAG: hypothetical protein WCS73_09780 [Lentisphaeria bacterium]
MSDDISKFLETKNEPNLQGDFSNGSTVEPNTTAISHVRKASLYSFIGFLVFSAILAIFSVISGSFSEFKIKVLITTSAIAVVSICSLCCSAYSGRAENQLPSFGGIALAGISAAMLIFGIWAELGSEEYWKTTVVLCVFAIASAHLLALLAVRLRPTLLWLQIATTISILVFALFISGMIFWEMYDEGSFKIVAVLAILAALETLVIPILGRANRV